MLSPERFVFRAVGPLGGDALPLLAAAPGHLELVPKQPQAELPDQYAWGDVFLFPTIEDGFAVVLAQASASGLPILSTTNCGGADFLIEGRSGWSVPIRRPDLMAERLTWCDANRPVVSAMVGGLADASSPPSWTDAAIELEHVCEHLVGEAATVARRTPTLATGPHR